MKQQKKTWRRILAFLLVAALTAGMLVGCGGNSGEGSGQQGAKGRFLENEVELPDGFQMETITKMDDGSLEVGGYQEEAYCLLRSTDMGQTWESVLGEEAWGKDAPYISMSAIAEDGTAALFETKAEESGGEYLFSYTLYLVSPKGKIKKQKITLPDEQDMLSQVVYDKTGSLFALDLNKDLLEIDAETGMCSPAFQTDGVNPVYFGIAGQTLCAAHEDGVMLIDTESRQIEEPDGALDDVVKNTDYALAPSTQMGTPMAFADGEDDSILFVNHEGIFCHRKGGSVNEQLVDGTLGSISDTSMMFLGIAQMDENNIFVAIYDSSGNGKLLHYVYDAEAAAAPEKEITIYSLRESTLLRQSVVAFQKSNPDVYVKMEVGMSGEDGVTAEDAIKLLNTNIMAGKGPDVLILDGLPMDSYVEKGVLEDISDVVDQVEQEDGLFANIRDVYRQDGKQYVMPVRFLCSLVMGDADTASCGANLGTIADRAVQLKKQNSKVNILPLYSKNGLLSHLYDMDSASWTQDNHVDIQQVKNYLTQAKRLYELDDYSEYEGDMDDDTDAIVSGVKIGTLYPLGILAEDCQMDIGTLSGISQMQMICSIQKLCELEFALADTDQAKSFVPYLMAGVVSGGDTETAKQFVHLLLGKEIGDGWDNGFPVNRAQYDEDCKEIMSKKSELYSAGYSNGEGKMVEVNYKAMTQEQVDVTTKLLESLTQPAMTDRVIRDLVLEQGEAYLDGTQDLDTAVNEIQKKINLYLSE